MSLSPGDHVGPFEILAQLGAGGMGEVYRARDTALDRSVAIKVLPATVAGDPDRLDRFEREARTLASLNHPNIAQIYGLEQAGGIRALVMELVAGEDLSRRIARGPVPLDEALAIARQIAEGLEAAHERGIVHRDLKPANVMVDGEGVVKILDFGLAKPFGADLPDSSSPLDSPTFAGATAAGVILGTVAYMPPEQARGKPVDRRADIWAFGAVLYELLAGTRAFAGDTVSDTLAAVLTRAPDWTKLPAGTPAAVKGLIERCLERDPRQRLQAVGEARILLGTNGPPLKDERAAAVPRVRTAVWVGAAVLAAGAVGLAAGVGLRQPVERTTLPGRFDIAVDRLDRRLDKLPVLSPDGRRIVYSAGGRLWVRSLGTFTAQAIAGSTDGRYPFWSPDSRQIAFVVDATLWRVAADGGEATPVGSVPADMVGSGAGAWTADDAAVVVGSNTVGILALPINGGSARERLPLDKQRESDFHDVMALPQGRGLLVLVHRLQGADTIALLTSGGQRKDVLQLPGETLRSLSYSADGHLLFARETKGPGVWAVPFSLDRLEVVGEPVLVIQGATAPSVGADGTLAVVRPSEQPSELVSIARDGATASLGFLDGQIEPTPAPWRSMVSSPDRQRLALSLIRSAGGSDLWTYDIARGSTTRLSAGAGSAFNPTWAADGSRVFFGTLFRSRTIALSWASATDSGELKRLGPPSETPQWPCTVSPDGRFLVYAVGRGANTDLWVVRLDGWADARPLMATPFREDDAEFSPDGRWLAYTSDESGRTELYVRAFPTDSRRVQVSTTGGSRPTWSPDGRTIYYRMPERVMEVALSRTPAGIAPSPPRQVISVQDESFFLDDFTATADGRFLFARSSGTDRLSVILNWQAALHPSAAARGR